MFAVVGFSCARSVYSHNKFYISLVYNSCRYAETIMFVLQPSTAGDVSNSESDECEAAVRDEPPQPEPVERWRSFSEGEQVRCVLKSLPDYL